MSSLSVKAGGEVVEKAQAAFVSTVSGSTVSGSIVSGKMTEIDRMGVVNQVDHPHKQAKSKPELTRTLGRPNRKQ